MGEYADENVHFLSLFKVFRANAMKALSINEFTIYSVLSCNPE